jgi:hypothetical protein
MKKIIIPGFLVILALNLVAGTSWIHGNLDKQGDVTLDDFSVLLDNYGREDCKGSNQHCNRADINKDGIVDLQDFSWYKFYLSTNGKKH